jgi:hypothetical protein
MESLQTHRKDDNDFESHNMKGKILVSNIFVLLGIGTLLPWNAFISAEPYFESRLCTSSNFMLWFGFIYNGMGVLSLAIMIIRKILTGKPNKNEQDNVKNNINKTNNNENVSSHQSDVEIVPLGGLSNQIHETTEKTMTMVTVVDDKGIDNSNQRKMVALPLSIFLAVFVFTSSLVLLKNISSNFFLSLTLVCIAICGSMSSIVGAGIIFVASIFPSQVGVNPYLSGQGAGGVIISSINFMTAIMDKPRDFGTSHCHSAHEHEAQNSTSGSIHDVLSVQTTYSLAHNGPNCPTYQIDWGAFAYFGICCIILGLCIVSYFVLEYLPFTQYCKNKVDNNQASYELVYPDDEVNGKDRIHTDHDRNTVIQGENHSEENRELSLDLLSPLIPTQQSIPQVNTNECKNTTFEVWKLIYKPAIAIFLIFAVTLAVFPSWIVKVQSVQKCEGNNRIFQDLFIPMSILLFNVGDLSGRVLTRCINIDTYENFSSKLLTLAAARIIILPLFLLCNVPGKLFQFSIESDFFFYVLLMSLSVSNGMVATLSFMHAPQLLPSNEEMQEISSTILTFAVGSGLLCGSSCSFLYNLVGTGKWT